MNLPLYSPTAPASGREAGIGEVGGTGPLPYTAERAAARPGEDGSGAIELVSNAWVVRCEGGLPFSFGREPRPGPAGEGVGLIMADVGNRRGGVEVPSSGGGKLGS